MLLKYHFNVLATSMSLYMLGSAAPTPSGDAEERLGASAGSAVASVVDELHSWGFSGAMLSIPRSSIAATSAGHKAFFAGGRLQNDTYTDVVDIFNSRTQQWTVSHLSMARPNIGAGSIADRYVLFAGGFDSNFQPLSLVDVYDTRTNTWSVLKLGTPRASPRVLDLGNVAAIVGGLSGDLEYLSNAVDYVDGDLRVSQGSLHNELPQFGIAAADKKLGVGLFTAGYQNNRPGERFNDFEASNQTAVFMAAGSSADIAAGQLFPSPRWGSGGAAANGLFAVGGGHTFGQDASEPLTTVVDRVDVYDSNAGRWSSSPLALSVPRDYPLAQAVGNYIVFASGTDKSKDLDILDTRTGKFVGDLQHQPSMYLQRSDAAATTVDDCLLIIAGGQVYQGANATASVEMFDACKHN
ncbi:hypothetical protein IW140_004565 [Coemansia sp. RSA 1813]|nr:hypothetical protein EV178_004652 [Coemansia sp. RSA 1646]KAJ1769362.1 hypothetical protein LPJ74_004126 [Coemansia sp. RSA 1843]KAJ2087742.1 hypothetical protein IW138_004770 [Coemansia sp. RSA 986]KAJ2213086.1 hypothetical protein EV179_004147 [Coemansia sp. RSA 487]KAJ2567217.1 hypothetical protein IW140_004565 [Coemansia sp. RSA 1813]